MVSESETPCQDRGPARPLGRLLLDRYILRRFWSTYVASLVSFTGLYVLIDAVSNLDRFSEESEGVLELAFVMVKSYAVVVPPIFCDVLGPAIAVCAGMFTITLLQRASEFTPILAAGRGFQRSLAPLLFASGLLSMAVFLVQELWIPRTSALMREADQNRKGDGTYTNFHHPDPKRGILIRIREYDSRTGEARGVIVLPAFRSEAGGVERLVLARTARWKRKEKAWILKDVTIQEYDENGLRVPPSPEGVAPALFRPLASMRLDTNLIPEDIESAERASFSTMWLGAVRHKAEESLDHRAWRVRYLSRFMNPLANFILVLVGLPIMVYFGSRNIFVGAILAVSVCAAYFGLNETFKDLGVRGLLPARVGATLAPVLFTSLGWTAYREMRS